MYCDGDNCLPGLVLSEGWLYWVDQRGETRGFFQNYVEYVPLKTVAYVRVGAEYEYRYENPFKFSRNFSVTLYLMKK